MRSRLPHVTKHNCHIGSSRTRLRNAIASLSGHATLYTSAQSILQATRWHQDEIKLGRRTLTEFWSQELLAGYPEKARVNSSHSFQRFQLISCTVSLSGLYNHTQEGNRHDNSNIPLIGNGN